MEVLFDLLDHDGIGEGDDLPKLRDIAQKDAVPYAVAAQLRVVLQGADHAHQHILAQQYLVNTRIIQHDDALKDGE